MNHALYRNCRSYIQIYSHQRNTIVAYLEKMCPRIHPNTSMFVVEVDLLHDAHLQGSGKENRDQAYVRSCWELEQWLITCSYRGPAFGLQPSLTPVTGYLHMVDIAGETLMHTNLFKRLVIDWSKRDRRSARWLWKLQSTYWQSLAIWAWSLKLRWRRGTDFHKVVP